MRKCPKCGYVRQPKDDELYPLTACPKCGIIYLKYEAAKQDEKETETPVEEETKEEQEKESPVIASYRRRILASIYTLFRFLCILLILFMAISILTVKLQILNPSKLDSIQSWTMRVLYFVIIFLLPILYAYLYVPVTRLSSWGQSFMGIGIVNEDDGLLPSPSAYVKRFLGNILTVLTFGIALIFQMKSKDRTSIADRLSGTSQIEAENMPDKPIRRSLNPLALFIILCLISGLVIQWLQSGPIELSKVADTTPEEKEQIRDAMEEAFFIKLLEPLAIGEKKYFSQNGSYLEDPGKLTQKCRDYGISLHEHTLFQIKEKAIQIRITDSGFEIGMLIGRGEKARVYSEKGYEGIKPWQE